MQIHLYIDITECDSPCKIQLCVECVCFWLRPGKYFVHFAKWKLCYIQYIYIYTTLHQISFHMHFANINVFYNNWSLEEMCRKKQYVLFIIGTCNIWELFSNIYIYVYIKQFPKLLFSYVLLQTCLFSKSHVLQKMRVPLIAVTCRMKAIAPCVQLWMDTYIHNWNLQYGSCFVAYTYMCT